MATSPFGTSGNVQDIAPVQLRGGFSPAPGVVEAVEAVAKVAVPAMRENMEQNIREDVTGQTDSLRLALQATRYPSLRDTIFSEEAMANPAVQQALSEYTLIQEASRSGRLPSQFALERLEQIQLNAVRAAPEFEQEIAAAMQDATGQRPTVQLFSGLLREPGAAGKTPEQLGEEKLRQEAAFLGIAPSALREISLSKHVFDTNMRKFDFAKAEGTYTANMLGSEVRGRSSEVMLDTLEVARKLVVAGEALTPETIQQLKARVSSTVGSAYGKLLAQTNGMPIDGSTINAELAPLRELETTIGKMLDDGSLQTLVSEQNEVVIELLKQGVLGVEELAMSYAVGGSAGFVQLLEFMNKAGDTAAGKALAGALSPKAGAAFRLQDIGSQVLNQYGKIGSQVPLETTESKQARILAAGIVLGTIGADPNFQMRALEDIRKYGGEELAWSSFDSDRVLTVTSKSNPLKAAFINMQVATSAGLTEELLGLTAQPGVDVTRLKLENDVLVIEQRPLEERVAQGRAATVSDAALQTFARRFNRANRISGKYQGAGILPAGRYGTAENYWNTIKETAISVARPEEPAQPEVIRYVRDENGNIVVATGG
jgi:hypothetical protein